MPFGDKLEEYLIRKHIHPDDIPKILGTFVAAKYLTASTFLFLGVRYRPLRRLFSRYWRSPRKDELQRVAIREASRKWSQTQNSQLYNQAKCKIADLRDWRKTKGVGDKQIRYVRARWDYEKNKRNIKEPFRIWLRREAEKTAETMAKEIEKSSLMRRIALQYKHYEEIFAKKVEENTILRKLAGKTGGDPKKIALGVAEGLILTKLAFPITGPLEMYLIAKMFQWRREKQNATAA